MNIEELEKKLYEKGAKEDDYGARPEIPRTFLPGQEKKINDSLSRDWQTRSDGKEGRAIDNRQKNIIKRVAIIAGAVIIIFGLFMLWQTFFSFDKNKAQLQIFGPDRIVGGEEINYVVRYKNNAFVNLKNASLVFQLPDGGSFTDDESGSLLKTIPLGEIKSQGAGEAQFKVQIMGVRGAGKKVTAKLVYQPANIKFSMENNVDFTSTIISVPLVINFDLPDKVVSGQTVAVILYYLNTSNAVFSDLKFKIDYPKGFQFVSAEPTPDEEDNSWTLNQLAGQAEGKIIISGILSGNQNDVKPFKAQVGFTRNNNFIALAEGMNSSTVSVSPLNIALTVNDADNYVTKLNDVLSYRVKYQNSTDVGINNVNISVKLDSNILDYTNFYPQKASFNDKNHMITWNAASLPDLEFLAPHTKGELNFSIRVKNQLSINSFDDKNFTITCTAKIDSADVPLSLTGTRISGQHQLIVKLNSPLTLNVKGYYNDNLIQNSGPLPPRVGEMTTYTVYWQILNPSNDLENVEVSAFLPSYVHWSNKFLPANTNITYEPATGKITWYLGDLPSATGILSPVKYVAFQVGLVPSVNQVGSEVDVIQKSKVSAHDLFTDMNLSVEAPALNSIMPDDPTVGWDKGKVSQ